MIGHSYKTLQGIHFNMPTRKNQRKETLFKTRLLVVSNKLIRI